MELPTYFSDFLGRIRLDESQQKELKEAHTRLTTRLDQDTQLKKLIVGTFLQGSYRRSTIIKPANGKKSDVDVVVVTKIGSDVAPKKALEHFVPFVRKHYQENFEPQSRSIGIVDGNVELDLVVTSAPSEAQEGLIKSATFALSESLEEQKYERLAKGEDRERVYTNMLDAFKPWKADPLFIPDRDINKWVPTHPIAQINWTTQKNKDCNDHYVNVVKALKWWHRRHERMPKYPKGYPVEHIIGYCCPNGIDYVATGVVSTFEAIENKFAQYIQSNSVPELKDHGVEQNVLRRLSPEEFKQFYAACVEAKGIAQNALKAQTVEDSVRYWKMLFGPEFDPEPEGSGKKGGFATPRVSSEPRGGRFG